MNPSLFKIIQSPVQNEDKGNSGNNLRSDKRRTYQRFEPELAVEFFNGPGTAHPRVPSNLPAKILNISEGGISLLLESELELSQSLTIAIKNNGTSFNNILTSVIWKNKTGENTDSMHAYGLKFNFDDFYTNHKVKQLLRLVLESQNRITAIERRKFSFFNEFIDELKEFKIYPKIKTLNGPSSPETTIDGKKTLHFGSNSSLGLSTHPEVLSAATNALNSYGTTCGGSRLVSGNLDLQVKLENRIASFLGTEGSMVFMTGYMANLGLIQVLTSSENLKGYDGIIKDSAIFCDRKSHASIINGCKSAEATNKCRVRYYKHRDMKNLESLLKKTKAFRKIIISDGVFSMTGDIAPIDAICKLAKKYHAISYIDDAHGVGIYGKNGRGTSELFDLQSNPIDILVGTMSKAFGGVGGFVAGKKELMNYFRYRTSTYIFSSALPPATSAGIIKAIDLVEHSPEYRKKLWENVKRMSNNLVESGFTLLNENSHIIPISVGDDTLGRDFSDKLVTKGVYCPSMRWPALPHNQSILRCMVSAQHTNDQIDIGSKIIEEVGTELGVI